MCTVVVLIRPSHVVLAANRDERIDREWDPPAVWWPHQPGIIGGRDRAGGGTWLGINQHSVVAAVLNRPGTLGPAAGKRSRGELPLIALDHNNAETAVAKLVQLDASAWRPFNMVVADPLGGWFIRGRGGRCLEAERLLPGVSMVTAHDPNDLSSPRTAYHLQRLQDAEPVDPHQWSGWHAILTDRSGSPGQQINVVPRAGFGTVCSSYITMTRNEGLRWLFAPGPPHNTEFQPVFCDMGSAAISATPPHAVTS